MFEQTLNPISKKSACQLQQPVILSLIQQLSQDLSSNVELKLKYIEEAVLNLDMSVQLTREHTPAVISQLIHKLQSYLQCHPSSGSDTKCTKQIRMLLLGSQSFLVQAKQASSQSAATTSSPSSFQSQQQQQQQMAKSSPLGAGGAHKTHHLANNNNNSSSHNDSINY